MAWIVAYHGAGHDDNNIQDRHIARVCITLVNKSSFLRVLACVDKHVTAVFVRSIILHVGGGNMLNTKTTLIIEKLDR